ncbi:MAG: hypothetical protein K5643_09370 [Saccharofermentans sp.]|nr:hypothetical protein [Saccharofermentans sp.]
MRRFLGIILVIAMAFSFAACDGGDGAIIKSIEGKTFVWEKPGFGGDFTITLAEDKTFKYDEGSYSSLNCAGNWSVKDGVLILEETAEYDNTFKFNVTDGNLAYMADGSSHFMYAEVVDGDLFKPQIAK